MKTVSIIAAGAALVFIVLTLAPLAGQYRAWFAIAALVCSAVALGSIVGGWRDRPATARQTAPAEGQSASMPSPPAPARPTIAVVSSEAAVVGFLATLQEKGRLVDFLQDDITGYSDAQVGAAARVVHQGCKAVVDEYFRVVPVRPESEGATITVPAGYAADEYRLVGKISGAAPFSGTLMHRGWKADAVTLPRVLRTTPDQLPTIAPAEVELR